MVMSELLRAEIEEFSASDRLEAAWKLWFLGSITLEDRLEAEQNAILACQAVIEAMRNQHGETRSHDRAA